MNEGARTGSSRRSVAAVLGAAGTMAVIAIHYVIPTATEWTDVPAADARSHESARAYGGSARALVFERRLEFLPGGAAREVEFVKVPTWGPVISTRFHRAESAAVTCTMLLLPLFFIAAWTTRRPRWRWMGMVAACTAGTGFALGDAPPWPIEGWHALHALWYATPAVWLAAFLLLPVARGQASPSHRPALITS